MFYLHANFSLLCHAYTHNHVRQRRQLALKSNTTSDQYNCQTRGKNDEVGFYYEESYKNCYRHIFFIYILFYIHIMSNIHIYNYI